MGASGGGRGAGLGDPVPGPVGGSESAGVTARRLHTRVRKPVGPGHSRPLPAADHPARARSHRLGGGICVSLGFRTGHLSPQWSGVHRRDATADPQRRVSAEQVVPAQSRDASGGERVRSGQRVPARRVQDRAARRRHAARTLSAAADSAWTDVRAPAIRESATPRDAAGLGAGSIDHD